MIDVIILAAGKSTRFGKNKILYSQDNIPCILELIIKVYSVLGFVNKIIVVTGHQKFKNEIERFVFFLNSKYNIKIMNTHNPDYEKGMFTSIKTGLNKSDKNIHGFFIQPGDCPGINDKLLNNIYQKFVSETNNEKIMIPSYNMKKGHPPLFSVYHKDRLLNYENTYNMHKYYHQNKENIYYVKTDNKQCINDIDTEQDYFLLQRGLQNEKIKC